MGGGCTCGWSPEVSGAVRIGGEFAGVCTELDAGVLDIHPFEDGMAFCSCCSYVINKDAALLQTIHDFEGPYLMPS